MPRLSGSRMTTAWPLPIPAAKPSIQASYDGVSTAPPGRVPRAVAERNVVGDQDRHRVGRAPPAASSCARPPAPAAGVPLVNQTACGVASISAEPERVEQVARLELAGDLLDRVAVRRADREPRVRRQRPRRRRLVGRHTRRRRDRRGRDRFGRRRAPDPPRTRTSLPRHPESPTRASVLSVSFPCLPQVCLASETD